MLEKKFNNDWKFWLEKDAFSLIWNVPEDARKIDLPHDAMIEIDANKDSLNKGNTGYRDGGVYQYVKKLFAPLEYKNKTVILKFEGVYMNAFVYVNGELAAKCPFGYSTFYADLNGYLNYGVENEIRVIVRNGAMPNSRWYTGSGIYRDVSLMVSELVYITPGGLFVHTEHLDQDYATLVVTTELKNRSFTKEELILENEICYDGVVVSTDRIPVVLMEQEQRKLYRRVTVEKPVLWSDRNPLLYTCRSRLYQGEVICDESITTFGIRTITLDAKRGLRVNGEVVKLRGACIHHDSGLLGAATYEEVHARQIRILKEAGFNAIRMSHQPMAPAMLRACDVLGVYVMDETFDMWNRCKSDYDYGLYFSEWWEKDVESMVRKDYNHPSVIMYSIGNEIPEVGMDHGAKTGHRIASKLKELDPYRYTLPSINGVFAAGDCMEEIVADIVDDLKKTNKLEGNVNNIMSLMDKHMDEIVVHPAIAKRIDKACAATDLVGYNYMSARYEMDGINYPNRVIVGSETYPPQIPRNWKLVKQCNHIIGDFTWTGWDYIGEAGVGVPAYQWGEGGFGALFPCQISYCGDIDITGFRRPVSYFREIVFGLRQKPYIAVQNPYHYGDQLIATPWVLSDSRESWTFTGMEGKPVIIEVYAPGTEVELFCNDVSLGKKPSGEAANFITLFEANYMPGVLTAVVYEDNREIGRSELKTASDERKIEITTEAVGEKFVYLPIHITDGQGIIVTQEDRELELKIEGDAELVAFGSGNPKPKDNFITERAKTFEGRALAIIRREKEAGAFTVKIIGQDIENAAIKVE